MGRLAVPCHVILISNRRLHDHIYLNTVIKTTLNLRGLTVFAPLSGSPGFGYDGVCVGQRRHVFRPHLHAQVGGTSSVVQQQAVEERLTATSDAATPQQLVEAATLAAAAGGKQKQRHVLSRKSNKSNRNIAQYIISFDVRAPTFLLLVGLWAAAAVPTAGDYLPRPLLSFEKDLAREKMTYSKQKIAERFVLGI